MRFLRFLSLFILLVSCTFSAVATHIRAADLYAKVNPGNSTAANAHRTIQYTLNVYADSKSVGDFPQSGCTNLGDCATLNFGDGSAAENVPYSSKTLVGTNTYLFVFYFTHTYPSDGFFEAGYFDVNRNARIENMSDPSTNLAFYIKMGITIERGLGSNQTPQMSIPPVDIAQTNRTFIHNPGAYDIDGDSISFLSYEPQLFSGGFDPKYVYPNVRYGGRTQDGTSPATYSVNSTTGDVIWNSPVRSGLYNIAFIIEEWRIIGRRRERISYSIRDMQIEVREGDNDPPKITVRKDSCIAPNVIFRSPVEVNDPNGDAITLVPYGELFDPEVSGNRAALTPASVNVGTPFRAVFSWNPSCTNVRNRPYQAFFKATDQFAANPLTDIKSFYLTVVGPGPQGLSVIPDTTGKRTHLKWNSYACRNTATRMEIYRRTGCDTVRLRNCVLGKPNEDYVLIGSVNISDTTFTDSSVQKGNIYSYAISAVFVDNFRITNNSYPSANVCIELPLLAPIITKVSFEGVNKNEILVSWIKPVDLDTAQFTGPYQYSLYKKRIDDAGYQLIKQFPPTVNMTDTSYLDTEIMNGSNYQYYVKFSYYKSGTQIMITDSSEVAANVILTTTPVNKGVSLQWSGITPWQNGVSGLYHYIWRKSNLENNFILLDSVSFNQNNSVFNYTDLKHNPNQATCDTFLYYVTTKGSYLNPKINPQIISNNSFITKGTILINNPPTAPVLNELGYNCDNFDQAYPYKNNLQWSPSISTSCLKVAGFNIYYSSKKSDEELPFLTKVKDKSLSFSHNNLMSIAGCYEVTSFDSLGNESARSNKVCVENCNLYELPNVFTPDNSGMNDLFRPIPPSPRFAERAEFKVFNRWGAKVFEKNDDVYLNWDGSGLPDGIYFYTVKVRFISIEEKPEEQEIKGWVQIIR